MKSSGDTTGTHAEALTWFGAAVVTLSMVSYSFQSIYRGLDSVFTAQESAPSGAVGFTLAAFVGLGLLLIGITWRHRLNRIHLGRAANEANDQAQDKTVAA